MRASGSGHGIFDDRLQYGSEQYSNDSRRNKFENTTAQAGATYTGTVTEVSAASITVDTEADGEVTIPLSDSTTFIRDGMGGPGGKRSDPAGWCRSRHSLCAGRRRCNSYRGKLQHRCGYLRCSGCRQLVGLCRGKSIKIRLFAAADLRSVRKGGCCAMKYSSPFHFTTCDAILRGCRIIGRSKPLQRQGI